MTELEMEKADGEILSRKIDNARNILYKVNISHQTQIFSSDILLSPENFLFEKNMTFFSIQHK